MFNLSIYTCNRSWENKNILGDYQWLLWVICTSSDQSVMSGYDLKEGYESLAPNMWKELFKMYELTEIMLQKNNKEFAETLNRLG